MPTKKKKDMPVVDLYYLKLAASNTLISFYIAIVFSRVLC